MSINASPERRTLVGKLAATQRFGGSEAEVTEIRRELHAQTLADAIKHFAEKFPPLSEDQRNKLALLLKGSNSDRSSRA